MGIKPYLRQTLILFGMAVASCVYGQHAELQWAKTYGGNEDESAQKIKKMPDGNLLILGRGDIKEGAQRLLCIDDEDGEKLWARGYCMVDEPSTMIRDIAILENGNIVMAGYQDTKKGRLGHLKYLDPKGKTLWQKNYTSALGKKINNMFEAVTVTPDGDILAVGGLYGTRSKDDYTEIWVTKIDKNGNLITEKNMYHSIYSDISQVMVAQNGDFLMVGSTDAKGSGNDDILVTRLDSDLNILWDRTFGGKDMDWGYGLDEAADGSIYVVGDVMDENHAMDNAFVVKLSADGDKQWAHSFGDNDKEDEFHSVVISEDGGCIAVGNTASKGAGEYDMYLVSLDANGKTRWEKCYGGSDIDAAFGVVALGNNTYTLAGYTYYEKRHSASMVEEDDIAESESDAWILQVREVNHEEVPLAELDPKVWALIVGVADYSAEQEIEGWKDLRYCHKDAQMVYDFLTSPSGGSVPPEQIAILKNNEAEHKAVLTAAKELYSKAGPNDLIIFYFSGHGGPNVFAGHDKNILHSELTSIIEASEAKKRLCIADACYSGSWNREDVAERRQLSDDEMNEMYYKLLSTTGNGLALFLSSNDNETSLEMKDYEHGLFTYYYIEGMKGEADENGDQVITIQELYDYVKDNVSDDARKKGNSQIPQLKGIFDHSMPLGIVR